MSCIEQNRGAAPSLPPAASVWTGRSGLGAIAVLAGLMAGCSSGPRAPAPSSSQPSTSAATPAQPASPSKPAEPAKPTESAKHGLPPPAPVRSHDELRKQAAQRLVAANPHMTYMGQVPAVLLAIPVLEVELKHDGHIKRINVLRRPGQAPDTVQLAIDAVHRAAPFGNVSRMPEPWKFSETFLFNDDRHFKPRTLD
ncbi:hypothetical protein [Kinneretia aquatilis]|uniref:hypothetical protein n=1 Tax=Kinneretia aquatilis TaxID=2070761 RepID=UPI001CBEBF1E|nr:hypothetical protein [Paucibacter aquatile]WIV99717.1 hypothetical protein K9V56_009695 [Paucibacter aquatile]